MTESLSIIVPVRNAQGWLARHVHSLLELSPELTDRFQLVVVDDGSTDHTPELADEMARQFPQVTAVHSRKPLGLPAAVDAGLAAATGEMAIVQRTSEPIRTGHLCRLWRRRHEVAGRLEATDEAPDSPHAPQRRDWQLLAQAHAAPPETSLVRFELLRREPRSPAPSVAAGPLSELPQTDAWERRPARRTPVRRGRAPTGRRQAPDQPADCGHPHPPALLPSADVPSLDQSVRALYS